MKLRLNLGMTLILLVAIALFGTGYMALGVLHMGAVKKTTSVTLMLKKSGGLLPTSDVTMRGLRIGRVTGVRTTTTGLTVSMEIDNEHNVPANSPVGVEALSAVGEQYIDFKPRKIAPPYLADGAVIPAEQVTYRATLSDMLDRSSALFSAINPKDLDIIVKNIGEVLDGSDDMFSQLATDASVYAKLVRENKQLFEMLFGNVDFFAVQMRKLNANGLFKQMSNELSPNFFDNGAGIGQGVEVLYTDIAEGKWLTKDSTIETLVAKIREYLDLLSGPLSTFAPVLESLTTPMRNDKPDVGHWIDRWRAALDAEGHMRVRAPGEQAPQQDPEQSEDAEQQDEPPQHEASDLQEGN
ncbi:MlaD family protein [Segniliparus rugosus]|uniref:Virulence factor Mce family protein n=1 Tax=Segniliparus rugosus (strain ATCC BAA-974 / DSM 45345 / CCUG 50838 / CIP 108380 / JCM 13579 / CDC 945) TaxID=679197 RepID=E5XTR2_SEGRC|nr:MlaD family protein [Segniliparus rugosus]EFV12265.1 virulence factor Mce family protein [Segniliparus rugosus ATCC BAA-974]